MSVNVYFFQCENRLSDVRRAYCRAKPKVVSAYFTSKHILPFAFAEQYRRQILMSKIGPRTVRVKNNKNMTMRELLVFAGKRSEDTHHIYT